MDVTVNYRNHRDARARWGTLTHEEGGRRKVRSHSRRSLAEACRRAGIDCDPHAIDEAGLGLIFLELLVRGIDHEWVGTKGWRQGMLHGAPPEPVPSRDQRQ